MSFTAFQPFAFQHDAFQVYAGGGGDNEKRRAYRKPRKREPERKEAPPPLTPPPDWLLSAPVAKPAPFVPPPVPAEQTAAVAALEQQAQDLADIEVILSALPPPQATNDG